MYFWFLYVERLDLILMENTGVEFPKNDKQERIIFLDSLKGLAVILVILGHIIQKYQSFNLYPKWTDTLIDIESVIYSFHMQLFMLISGFLFEKAYFSIDGKIKQKRFNTQFMNLFLVYIFFSLFEGCIKIFFSQNVISQVTVADLFLILFKPIGGRLWYLYVLMEYYCIFSRKIIQKNIGKIGLLLTITVISILNVYTEYAWLFSIRRALRDSLSFYVGMVICRYGVQKIMNKTNIVVLSFIALVRLFFYGFGCMRNDIPFLSVMYGTIIATAIFGVFKKVEMLSNSHMLSSIGICSLEMFMLQEYPLTLCTLFLPKLVHNTWFSIISNAVITVISIMVFKLVTVKINIYDFFFRPYVQIKRWWSKNDVG